MHVVEIWIFVFLTLASNSLCQRIECNWAAQWLCGDQCLGQYNSCLCGNETITYNDAYDYNCCNQGTCSKEVDGNVKCQGLRQDWRVPCNGECKQYAVLGYTTIACNDQQQCVKSISLCQGVPVCHE